LLRCPATGGPLEPAGGTLNGPQGNCYPVSDSGVPLFATGLISADAQRQRAHYDAIAAAYEANLAYPHTRAYLAYLDEVLLAAVGARPLGTMAELCCGLGEAVKLFAGRYNRAVAIDISPAMLERAVRENRQMSVTFVQADATRLPLANEAFDTVVLLGGVHHVNDRARLFAEVARILKPGGHCIFREPVSDFAPWRWLRAVVYRLSPMLDHATERPLLRSETEPPVEAAGLVLEHWSTHGFLGFCLFMNSDVLFFNRLFRFIPGIAVATRAAARLDAWTLRLPGLSAAGLQVVGIVRKPA
jgi:ubiquinone/menaquinone biosynthesis C-methylase UbiE